jgi:4-alpha-glucanotransferase
MKVTFLLRFHTRPGQSLWLSGSHPLMGNNAAANAIPLEYVDENFWRAAIRFPVRADSDEPINYHYILIQPDGTRIEDWGQGRSIQPASFNVQDLLVIDAWNHAGFFENAFYTEPFKEVLLRANHTDVPSRPAPRATHTFRVKSPLLRQGQTLCLLGSTPELGSWNINQPVLLRRGVGEDYFTVQLDLSHATFPLEYKYGVYEMETGRFARYEDGRNRWLDDFVAAQKHTLVSDGFAVLPSTSWRGAGVAIPVFSLRTEASFGVGEFTDLKLLADWCCRTGLRLIQILPVNDTVATHSWTDSYPYAAISAFALHPLYLNLSRVLTAANRCRLEALDPERRRLNALPQVDYEAVMRAKLAFLKEIFPLEQDRTLALHDYTEFFERNRHWLVPYAAFSYLRDQYGTPDASKWASHGVYDPQAIAQLTAQNSPAYAEISIHFFVQYHLHVQLLEATGYAHSKGVILKGDIPIGVYRHGVEAWQDPEFYCLQVQAGAPPDAFAVKGQNWSFPTYNWPRMKQDGFAWWKRRFQQMGEYFDAFRIDHILGFFRIWSVPLEAVEGILGYFVPALPVSESEIREAGVNFPLLRLVEPYITDDVVSATFGTRTEAIKSKFLIPEPSGGYRLRPEFATQRLVEEYFADRDAGDPDQPLKLGLFDLISNVILLDERSPGGTREPRYHFRFAIESTSSFQSLEPHIQDRLKRLYIDYFFVRQEAFWRQEGLDKLPALKRVTNMLVCGEDLGLVPACVPEVMHQLGLLSLEIQRMPKVLNMDFSRPREAPYLSVVSPSTHDMSTIRGWWQEDRQAIQKFYNQELGQTGPAPQRCDPEINRAIVAQHLTSPAMWSIFQLQDLLGMDESLRHPNPAEERINVPANPKNYWRYRMHLPLETLLQAERFNEELSQLVRANGRGAESA